jgi:exosortase/archaeosortase family protein
VPNSLRRFCASVPDRFLAALIVASAYGIFLTFDQMYWWRLKSDYAFGWLVPIFVAYVVIERWPRLREAFQANGPSPLNRWQRGVASTLAAFALTCGLAFFLLGAVYRAGAGVTQPGSLALAIGFSGVLLGMIYFNMPEGRVGNAGSGGFLRAFRTDARLRAVGIFMFPALVWILSAPLVTAVENAVSLFLLRKVVTVVFTIFGVLGYPLVQEGNVLVLPHGRVGVAEACSGIRSLTACLFAGSFLAAVFLDKLWKKVLLVSAALILAFFTNLLRSLFLTAWAYAYGSDAIEGTLHDMTGFAVLGLTSVGLFCLLPLFRGASWRRWSGLQPRGAH